VALIVVNLNRFAAPAGKGGWTLASQQLPSKNNNPACLVYVYPALAASSSTATTVHPTFAHEVTSLVITGKVGKSTIRLYP
jgi:hypothetical protein